MNCPECDVEMEREDKVSEAMVLAGTVAPVIKERKTWGAEYFCSQCHESWYYDRAGLRKIGSSTGPARDAIASYAGGYVDENGQVW